MLVAARLDPDPLVDAVAVPVPAPGVPLRPPGGGDPRARPAGVLFVAYAINTPGPDRRSRWGDQDGFFYDVLHRTTGEVVAIKVRSIVGAIPLLAVTTIERVLDVVVPLLEPGAGGTSLLALLSFLVFVGALAHPLRGGVGAR